MTAPVDVVNMALTEMGARQLVSGLSEDSPAGLAARTFYAPTRDWLLRSAPWGFARKTVILTELGLATDDPNIVPYPWLAMYAYPADCVKFRYVLPPPWPTSANPIDAPDVSGGPLVPWCPPSRAYRYLVSFDDTSSPARRVLLSNVPSAYGVYTARVEDCELWDPGFTQALQALLAYRFILPLSGNVAMKRDFYAYAEKIILEARAQDGNEAITSSDIRVDWIEARATINWGGGLGPWGSIGGVDWGTLGLWYSGYDNLSWGM